jgi:hypothetical protein
MVLFHDGVLVLQLMFVLDFLARFLLGVEDEHVLVFGLPGHFVILDELVYFFQQGGVAAVGLHLLGLGDVEQSFPGGLLPAFEFEVVFIAGAIYGLYFNKLMIIAKTLCASQLDADDVVKLLVHPAGEGSGPFGEVVVDLEDEALVKAGQDGKDELAFEGYAQHLPM